jgi:hypothetical protein
LCAPPIRASIDAIRSVRHGTEGIAVVGDGDGLTPVQVMRIERPALSRRGAQPAVARLRGRLEALGATLSRSSGHWSSGVTRST